MAWDSVTKPKLEGGLGLRNLSYWNMAAAIKLIWILFFRPASIWSSWFLWEVPWIKVKLGNGETTYFWSSNWSPYGRIRDYTHSESSTSLGIASNSTLAELWEMDHWILPGTRRFGSQVGFLSINF